MLEPLHEKILLNLPSKLPLEKLATISLQRITYYQRKEVHTLFATSSFQIVVESDEVSPQYPLSQTK